ncbi:MAG TPA: hypothetical protein VHW47_07885, partial [Acidimicrobiales bacterium]|nr:hypothetical protein [Acidimicrobiales bacterium]
MAQRRDIRTYVLSVAAAAVVVLTMAQTCLSIWIVAVIHPPAAWTAMVLSIGVLLPSLSIGWLAWGRRRVGPGTAGTPVSMPIVVASTGALSLAFLLSLG